MAETTTATSYKEATGKIAYGLTNDYMFKIVLESNIDILKALICALLHLSTTDIISIEVMNPIIPGNSIGDKEFILDIKIIMNNLTVINLEMQLRNLGNWIDRSLSYLSRSFDKLLSGQDYNETMSAIHIGFLDFTLFKDKPEFYATYKMMNTKNFNIYSDKFILSVVDLSRIDLATEEDKAYGIDQWATIFKAQTWEELRALATQNAVFNNVAETMFRYSCDRDVLEQCRKIEDQQKYVAYQNNKIESLEADKSEMSNTIAEQAAEIAALKAELAKNNK
jgi:predicted transposase/invertase (TIGR01784 family)